MAVTHRVEDGIAEIVMQHPPVNSLTVGDTWKIRDALAEVSRAPDLRAGPAALGYLDERSSRDGSR